MKIRGVVIQGKKRGKDLGFPTANIALTKEIPEGIYISTTELAGKHFQSLTFIGSAKTFDEVDVHAETYILDFDEDIYGRELEIALLKKIRNNQKFVSASALVKQMKDDTMQARTFFKSEARNPKF